MEKVVVATGNYPLNNEDMREVNQYLARGWSVKTVTTQNTKDHMTVIFVLESEVPHGVAGTYKSNPLWAGRVDYITLKEDGTYICSEILGARGMWKRQENQIIAMPQDGSRSWICVVEEEGVSISVGGRVFTKDL